MERIKCTLLIWAAVAAVLAQNLVVCVVSEPNLGDQKTYYSPGTPPVSHTPPTHHATPTPSHGTPSHGGGGSYTPPTNCGTPPSRGGGHHHTTPSPPTSGGGGYYRPPPTSTPSPTPITPITPITPVTPTTPTPITPITPITPVTPTTPIPTPTTPTPITFPPIIIPPIPGTPTIPGITIPSPPFPFDPNSPPFTCTYWRNHPALIWGLFGYFGTIGGSLGAPSIPGISASTNLLQALSNTRTDGFGELYREGTAALLNSMARTRFPYTTTQVRDSFVSALGSNKAAGAQARLFKLANEGKTKPRI